MLVKKDLEIKHPRRIARRMLAMHPKPLIPQWFRANATAIRLQQSAFGER